MGGVFTILRDFGQRAFVEIERVLRDSAQGLERKLLVLVGEKLRVAAAIWKIREAEMAPHGNVPVAVAVVHGLDRGAIGISEIFVEIGGTVQRLERGAVAAVLIVFGDGVDVR